MARRKSDQVKHHVRFEPQIQPNGKFLVVIVSPAGTNDLGPRLWKGGTEKDWPDADREFDTEAAARAHCSQWQAYVEKFWPAPDLRRGSPKNDRNMHQNMRDSINPFGIDDE